PHRIANADLREDVLLRVWIASVGAGGVRHHGGIELLAEFAAHLGNAALGVFRKLQRLSAVLHGIDSFAGAVLEIAQHAFQLLLHLAQLLALFLAAFDGKMLALVRQARPARDQFAAAPGADGRESGRRPGLARSSAGAPGRRSPDSVPAFARS